MSMAEKHVARFGKNMQESLGVRAPGDSPSPATPPSVGPDTGRTRAREAGHMELACIIPDPDQPRKSFDAEAIARLATSLRGHGQLQPVRVRWRADLLRWMLLEGEYRYRAALLAGLKTLACIFVDRDLTRAEILEGQLIENRFRVEVPPVEEARGFQELMAARDWSQRQLAAFLEVSPAWVSRSLSLLAMPPRTQELLEEGSLTVSDAVTIKGLPPEKAAENAEVLAARKKRQQKVGPAKPQPLSRTFNCGEASVRVTFKREASLGEIRAALEDALLQAMSEGEKT